MRSIRTLVALVAVSVIALSIPAWAQEDDPVPDALTMTTDYLGVAVEAGDQASFDLVITAPDPTPVALRVSGLGDGWTSTFRGGGFEVDGVMAGPTAPPLTLDVSVPGEASEGTYEFTVLATGAGETAELDLQVRVSAEAGGEVTLTPDFPGLRAPAGETATFSLDLRNDTPADLEFELSSTGPAGWDVTAEPTTERQATTIQVDSGSSTSITVEATSPVRAEAGQYLISVQATAGQTQVDADMVVEIVGSFSLDLTTIDQRLSTDVSGDGSSDIELVLTNTGTAPIQNISLSSTPPAGWEVTFPEPVIDQLAAGQSVTAVATVVPSDQAIAGDYVITFSASSDQANDQVDIRTTVNPSALWGFVGIGLIALTLAGLAWVFRRFGRR